MIGPLRLTWAAYKCRSCDKTQEVVPPPRNRKNAATAAGKSSHWWLRGVSDGRPFLNLHLRPFLLCRGRRDPHLSCWSIRRDFSWERCCPHRGWWGRIFRSLGPGYSQTGSHGLNGVATESEAPDGWAASGILSHAPFAPFALVWPTMPTAVPHQGNKPPSPCVLAMLSSSRRVTILVLPFPLLLGPSRSRRLLRMRPTRFSFVNFGPPSRAIPA